jgi:uncharacterized membrane protein YraQ (UPF0718 family)
MNWLSRAQDGVTIFLGVLIEAIPFLLLGVIVSQFLAMAVRGDRLLTWLPRGRVTSLAALTGLGALFPVCECGNVPVARRLAARGIPAAGAMVFLLAAPSFNPIVALSTYSAFRFQPSMVLYRLSFTFLVALGIGLLLSLHPKPAELLRGRATPKPGHDDGPTPKLLADRVRRFGAGALGEFLEMGAVLVVGAALAALTQVFVPRDWLLGIGQGPIVSVAVMMGLAVLLSVCSTVDAFVALAYAGTFTDGSLVSFLVFGPMVDLKAVLLMLTVFRAKVVALVTLLIAEAVFLIGIGLNYWLP